MRKMLLKLSSTVFPITLNPIYQPLGWMGPWMTWLLWPRMVTINLILLVSLVLHKGKKPYAKDQSLNL